MPPIALDDRYWEALWQRTRFSCLGAFSHGLIHNLNGPLQNMAMLTELLLGAQTSMQQLSAELPTEQQAPWQQMHQKSLQQLRQLAEQVQRLVTMVRELMEIQALEENAKTVDLHELITKLMPALRVDLFYKHQVQLELQLTAGLPPVAVPARDLIPILVQLFQNAMRALAAATQKRLTIVSRHSADKVVLEFRDSGCGFSPAAQNFAPYYSHWPQTSLDAYPQAPCSGMSLACAAHRLANFGAELTLTRTTTETIATITFPTKCP